MAGGRQGGGDKGSGRRGQGEVTHLHEPEGGHQEISLTADS